MTEMERNHSLKIYFEEAKEQLLLENSQSYKVKKAFRTQKDAQGSANAQCYRFRTEEQEELEFDHYSQILFDSHSKLVVAVNYKAQDGHYILYGFRNDNRDDNMISLTKTSGIRELVHEMESHTIEE